MEVVIDGVRYLPENDIKVFVHGIGYDSVEHWLYNVDCKLVNKWAKTLKDGENPNDNPQAVKLNNEIYLFREFVEKYLGFKWDNDGYCFKDKEE